MEKDSRWKMIISPAVAPMTVTTAEGSGDNNWRSSGNTSSTVNAVSFGFLATAILVSMFLVMAVVERIFRPRSATATATPAPGEAGFRVNLSDGPCKRRTSLDARRNNSYIYRSSSSSTMSSYSSHDQKPNLRSSEATHPA
ncbi:hypothetical protein Ancab_007868 [Ancistrocladus abbreviatus]